MTDQIKIWSRTYAHSNPVNYTDPSGYFTLGELIGGMNIKISGVAYNIKALYSTLGTTKTGQVIIEFGQEIVEFAVEGDFSQEAIAWFFAEMVISSAFNVDVDLDKLIKNVGGKNVVKNKVGDYLAKKAPKQVTPGVNELSGQYVNDLGNVQPWKAYYDEYGRLEGRTDYNAGNKKEGIPDIHYHTYEWGPGKIPYESGSHIEGAYKK